jgi:hypothetical protein
MEKKMKKTTFQLTVLVTLMTVSSQTFAEGLLTTVLTNLSDLFGLTQSTALKGFGVVGLVLTGFCVYTLYSGGAQSGKSKGAAAGGIVVGIILMFLGVFVTGTADELDIPIDGNAAIHEQLLPTAKTDIV